MQNFSQRVPYRKMDTNLLRGLIETKVFGPNDETFS